MAPPSPPSASYLLDIQTDSEHSDEDDDDKDHDVAASQEEETSEQQQDDTNTASTSASPSTKKKKKKKRKKRRKKKQPPLEQKQVRFGSVSVREHERCLGVDGVPLDGGWPLGISPTIVKEYQVASSVNEFEERRQDELKERWLDIMNQHVERNNDGFTSTPPLVPPTHLETRQYDYRKRQHEITKSTKNPLFGPLNEDDRMHLLIANDDNTTGDDDSSSTIQSCTDAMPIPKSPTRSLFQKSRRTRSNSMHNDSSSSSNKQQRHFMTRRNRSNSEQYYSEHYPSTEVLHVRNELEQIRIHRNLEGSIGCTCRKLDVYIPPPDGGGKKAQHRRLKPQKVKEELRRRGKLPSTECTRAELEQLLHDVVEKEPCCWGEDCFCKKNGIGCQADACSCWFESHQRKGNSNRRLEEDNPTVECIRERCGNNMYAVDLDGIHCFRLQYCQQAGEEEI